jgi:hypothetical protein
MQAYVCLSLTHPPSPLTPNPLSSPAPHAPSQLTLLLNRLPRPNNASIPRCFESSLFHLGYTRRGQDAQVGCYSFRCVRRAAALSAPCGGSCDYSLLLRDPTGAWQECKGPRYLLFVQVAPRPQNPRPETRDPKPEPTVEVARRKGMQPARRGPPQTTQSCARGGSDTMQ